MKTQKIIEEIEALKHQIDSHGKFPEGVLKKINYKFRLDWNYYSNRMEGGTLTRDETRSVMVGNVSVEGKPLKDVLEMNGHDEVVREILQMGAGKKRLSEKRIKEVHKAIIKEEDDPEKKQEIGKWKSRPNEIINYKNEKISFTQPGDVTEEIHELLNRVNADLDAFFKGSKAAKHPLFIAADFHLDYVSIHPFFDGNGRTARIFTNLILISCGYPPIIIKDDEKEGYYQTLADIQAYNGNPDLFYRLMAKTLQNSLQLILDAIEGREIEEVDDISKEIQLFNQRVKAIGEKQNVVKRNNERVDKVLNTVFLPMLFETDRYWSEIRDHFEKSKATVKANNTSNPFNQIIDEPELYLKNIKKDTIKNLSFEINLETLKIALPKRISKSFWFKINFDLYQYTLNFSTQKGSKIYYYGDEIDENKFKALVKEQMKNFIRSLNEFITNPKNLK
ncbi:Fic family protein [Salegentibacter sp. LM13S]|uniref:Fic family protein n=1 Tax=Salegentibacter lacus TaxID=2873599 RepID=UPI001CCA5245|nr:Fic family protein [Salegentibacter lacus]MBZ9631619.1 Fic family protein [Salegentibacter lacus]